MTTSLNNIQTQIDVVLREDGKVVGRHTFHNTFTFRGVDVLVKALVSGLTITHLYAFTNYRGYGGILPSRAVDLRTVKRENFTLPETVGNTAASMRFPIIGNTVLSSDSNYVSNKLVYTTNISGVSVAGTVISGNYTQAQSEVRALSLAVAQSLNHEDDIIFSVIDIPEASDPANRAAGESFLLPSSGTMELSYNIIFKA